MFLNLSNELQPNKSIRVNKIMAKSLNNTSFIEDPPITINSIVNEPVIHSAESIPLDHSELITEECQILPAFETNEIIPKYCIFEDKTVLDRKCEINKISIEKVPFIENVDGNKKENISINKIVEVVPSKILKIDQKSKPKRKYQIV